MRSCSSFFAVVVGTASFQHNYIQNYANLLEDQLDFWIRSISVFFLLYCSHCYKICFLIVIETSAPRRDRGSACQQLLERTVVLTEGKNYLQRSLGTKKTTFQQYNPCFSIYKIYIISIKGTVKLNFRFSMSEINSWHISQIIHVFRNL